MQIQNALLTGSTTVYGPITFVSGSIIGSASYAQTSSYADTFTVAGSLTAQTLVVQTITSSVSFITGSTRFGSLLTNTHTFTGSLQVTGSGPHTVFGNVQVGNNASVGTTTPVILSLGGTFNSGTAGSNVKLRVYESTSDGAIGGMSVSSGQMEINTWSSGRIAFYRGTTQTAVFDTGGSLGIGTATPLSRLHLETSSVSNGNILTLRNSAAWSTPMMTSIAIRDASNDVGAIGWRYNAAGTTVDMHIHSLYNSAYTNINNIVMTVRGNGNVGIGTVLPNASLHVSGSGSGSLMQISSHVSSSIFFVSGSGNIGIGTTTPSAKLEVNVGLNSLKISGRDTYVDSTEDPTNANIYVTQAGVGDFSQLAGNLVLQARTQGTVYRDIIFAGGLSNGDALMTILGEGNVGIGVSPTNLLHVAKDLPTEAIVNINNTSSTGFGVSITAGGGTRYALSLNDYSGAALVRFLANGSVGIGTTDPSGTKLRVEGGELRVTTSNAGIALYYAATYGEVASYNWGAGAWLQQRYNALSHAWHLSGGASAAMTITSAGSLTIGTTEVVGSNSKLVVSSSDAGPSFINQTQGQQNLLCWNKATSGDNLWVEFHAGSSLGVKGSIDYNRASNVTRFNTSSDINLKNIIGDSDKQKSIGILSSTKIREYSWKDDTTNKPQIGVIAQELYQTFKGAVSKGSDDKLLGTEDYKPWAVDKTAFTFHLIAGWQEHERIIQELSTKLDEATTRIKTLESK